MSTSVTGCGLLLTGPASLIGIDGDRYDQAQLARCALEFAQICDIEVDRGTNHDRQALERDKKMCLDLAADILEYSLDNLMSTEGAFFSAEDADSAAVKGGHESGRSDIWGR